MRAPRARTRAMYGRVALVQVGQPPRRVRVELGHDGSSSSGRTSSTSAGPRATHWKYERSAWW